MRRAPYQPIDIMPQALATAVRDLRYWFVIGGQAVRCFAPYRPSRDVDFGVPDTPTVTTLLQHLEATGRTEVLELGADTAHLLWNGTRVSIFALEPLVPFTDEQHLTVTGILATKLHAILDRGARRDFFDLYVLMQQHQLGIASCLAAIREVYGARVSDPLLLRSLTYFDDAEQEAALPGEGETDWATVKAFFIARVGDLIVPPTKPLAIQAREVDVSR